MNTIRPPAVAGQFYPEDPKELRKVVEHFLDLADLVKVNGKLKALIVPHAGYIFSGPVAAFGYKLATRDWTNKSHIFLLGPSHQVEISDPIGASFDFWQTPLGKIKAIDKIKDIKIFNPAHVYEHCLEVQLPFLQVILQEFTITPIVLNDFNESLVRRLTTSIEESDYIIVSSDLSHYHSYEKAVEIDTLANQSIPQLDFEKTQRVEACGLAAILSLIKVAQAKRWQGKLLNYQNSGDTYGDKERVVGYGCYGFFE